MPNHRSAGFLSQSNIKRARDARWWQVSRVVMIPGIVISASKVQAKAMNIFAQCRGCQNIKQIPVRAGFAGATLPRKCEEPRQPGEASCPLDPYQILPDKCQYVDIQKWRLQVALQTVRVASSK